jgi:hypothetical protein
MTRQPRLLPKAKVNKGALILGEAQAHIGKGFTVYVTKGGQDGR